LPLLTHPQMLEITQKLERRIIEPGETIIQRDQPVEAFFIIEKGMVNVVLQGRRKDNINLARLGEGEFFGEVELVRGGMSIANVRAYKDGPVELLALSRADFNHMLDQSPLTQESISAVVQERVKLNKSADRRKWRLGK